MQDSINGFIKDAELNLLEAGAKIKAIKNKTLNDEVFLATINSCCDPLRNALKFWKEEKRRLENNDN